MANWAALFDWDGVVIDSSGPHERSWEALAREEGRVLPADHFRRGFGMKNARIIPELLGWTQDPAEIRRLSLRKEALYREIVQAEGIRPLPGSAEWLRTLRAAGVPCVVGSSTDRLNITTILGLMGLEDCFCGMVTSEDVSQGKPHPEVFLKAAEKAGRPPGRCVVFEDALVGIAAARAGGIKVVGVATTHPPEEIAHADRVVRRLDELTLESMEALLDG
jgi:HAD superfamily hydrolase (TIGR01509 family)